MLTKQYKIATTAYQLYAIFEQGRVEECPLAIVNFFFITLSFFIIYIPLLHVKLRGTLDINLVQKRSMFWC
jgi:hypothetical protein